MLSSLVKRSPSLWLHNKLRLFHWCSYDKQNITRPLVDVNFIFSCSTRNLSRLHEHSKIKFLSTCGHVISPLYNHISSKKDNPILLLKWSITLHSLIDIACLWSLLLVIPLDIFCLFQNDNMFTNW